VFEGKEFLEALIQESRRNRVVSEIVSRIECVVKEKERKKERSSYERKQERCVEVGAG
jgi:hypothetical protein